ncbi:MAG: GNAT family N-acetyltransferase [Thermoplasmata archaeon]|nr:MAG: GNAT family N-acetyltransferase [Thermoplasmata archaeon]
MVTDMANELLASQIEILKRTSPEHIVYIKRKKEAKKLTLNFIQRLIWSKNGLVLIAEKDGKVAGYIAVMIKKNIPIFKIERVGYITDIYVRKQYRRSGISSQLEREGLKWLKKKGVSKVMLNVFPGNRNAISVYKKWGFSEFILDMRKTIQ